MKKVFVLMIVLAALCTLALTSPQPVIMSMSSPGKTAPVASEKVVSPTPNPTDNHAAAFDKAATEAEVIRLQAEIDRLNGNETAVEPLKERLHDLREGLDQANNHSHQGHIIRRAVTQAGEDWANATLIPTLPFSDSGVMGNTDDCVGRPYGDVFYKWVANIAGRDSFNMCGSAADTYFKIYVNPTGPCTGGTTYTSDDACGNDPAYGINVNVGDVIYIECGNYYSTDPAGTYNFNAFGPSLAPGRCCYGDVFAPQCQYVGQADCATLGGTWDGTKTCSNACPVPPAGALCGNAIRISDIGSWTGSTCGMGNDYSNTCLGSYDGGEDIIYAWTVTTEGQYRFNLTTDATWVGILVDGSCPPASGTCLAMATSSGSSASIGCTQFAPGTYYIMIDTYPSPDCIPNFTLSITQCSSIGRCCYGNPDRPECADNTQAECTALSGTWDNTTTCAASPCVLPPVGRCCYGDPFAPSCQTVGNYTCTTLSGTWTSGQTCEANPCPVRPANDACAGAIPVAIPSQTNGTTVGATSDAVPTCVVSNTSPSVWYTLVGNDHRVTVGLCTSSFDTQLMIYTGSCGNFTCVTGDDDACDSPNGNGSRVTFCTDLGVTYYIYVSGWNGNNGTFTLDVADGDNCHIDCSAFAACGTPAETEPNNTCTASDPSALACGSTVYGTICPQSDVDIYNLSVPAMTILSVSIFDGTNCATSPASLAALDILNDTCGVVSTNQHSGWSITNNSATGIRFKLKVHGDGQSSVRYKLTTACCEMTDYAAHPVVIPAGVFHYESTVNTCCATRSVPFVWSSACAGSQYTSGPSVMFKFTLASAGNVSFTANASSDDQMMVFTDPANPTTTCVGSADATSYPEVISNLALPAGTYYVSVSLYGAAACGQITLVVDSDTPLPVVLSGNAVATPQDGAVTLNWTTASENNNARFEIVRDGAVVGRMDGAGTSPVRHSYRFTDNGLTNGTTYSYILRSVNTNGDAYELATVSATPTLNAAVISEYALHQNYPNPFNPTTSIAVDLVESGNVTLKVYNLMGQEVASLVNGNLGAGRHVVSFDASHLSSGIYLYRLNVNGFVAEKKMLLMK